MTATGTRVDRGGTRARPRWPSLVIGVSAMLAIASYLFVTAPPPLAAVPAADEIPIRTVFTLLDAENDAARALWTDDIVKHGKAVGLAFDQRWRESDMQAGPLPALFLRATAHDLERTPFQLALFLGSRFPINPANQLTGIQATRFAAIEATGAPQFFFEPTTQRYTAMFADRAASSACVDCHDHHPDSPKRDWALGAVMGATTWMYPEPTVSRARALELVGALRTSIRATYVAYLAKVATFARRPEIGERWPASGFYLPSADVFMRELERRTSPVTLDGLIAPSSAEAIVSAARDRVAAAGAPPAGSGPPQLVIRTAQLTNVIVAREHERLLIAWMPAGGSTALRTAPPVELTLSDAHGVEVEYGGKRIALPSASASPSPSDRDAPLVLTITGSDGDSWR